MKIYGGSEAIHITHTIATIATDKYFFIACLSFWDELDTGWSYTHQALASTFSFYPLVSPRNKLVIKASEENLCWQVLDCVQGQIINLLTCIVIALWKTPESQVHLRIYYMNHIRYGISRQESLRGFQVCWLSISFIWMCMDVGKRQRSYIGSNFLVPEKKRAHQETVNAVPEKHSD